MISGRIVGTTRYFPSVGGDLVVADLPTWLAAANTADPGTATASELWRDAPPPSGVPLDVSSQRAREHELSSDPLARGAVALLLVTAVVGLVLAAVGLLLTVLGDLRDERGALFDLSAQGSTLNKGTLIGALRAGSGLHVESVGEKSFAGVPAARARTSILSAIRWAFWRSYQLAWRCSSATCSSARPSTPPSSRKTRLPSAGRTRNWCRIRRAAG